MVGNSSGSSSRIRTPPAIATITVAMPISTPARRAVDGFGCIEAPIVYDARVVAGHPPGVKPPHPIARELAGYDALTDAGVASSADTGPRPAGSDPVDLSSRIPGIDACRARRGL